MKKDEYSFLELFGNIDDEYIVKHCNRGKGRREDTWYIISGEKRFAWHLL